MRDPWKRGGESSGEQRCGRKESRGDGTSECSTGVHVPTTYPAYLSLRCARDILISSTLYIYIYISLLLSPPPASSSSLPSTVRSIRLSTSLGLRFHPFRPVLFLIYRPFLFIPLHLRPPPLRYSPFCSPLLMIISFAFFPSCCVYTPVVHGPFASPPSVPFFFFLFFGWILRALGEGGGARST